MASSIKYRVHSKPNAEYTLMQNSVNADYARFWVNQENRSSDGKGGIALPIFFFMLFSELHILQDMHQDHFF